jgi:hypothetical protein
MSLPQTLQEKFGEIISCYKYVLCEKFAEKSILLIKLSE